MAYGQNVPSCDPLRVKQEIGNEYWKLGEITVHVQTYLVLLKCAKFGQKNRWCKINMRSKVIRG